MDQPSVDGVNTYFVARVVHHGGLKVALSGLGGDELFGGYDTFRQVPKLAGTLGAIPGLSTVGRAFRAVAGPLVSALASPKWAGLLELGGSYAGAYLLRRGLFMPWELPDVMDPDMARAGWEALQPLARLQAETAEVESSQNRVRALETAVYMRNQLLRDADWAGMAHSLEIRVPFVDPVLFAALAPKFATKRAMAETPAKPLPDAVLNRPKTGFFVPVERWTAESAGKEGAERGLRGWARKVYKAQAA